MIFKNRVPKQDAKLLIHNIFGKDVYEGQYDYLVTTKMPNKMDAADWINQIKGIVEHFPLLKESAEKMDERKIAHKIITKNIPSSWEKDFILKESNKAKTLEEAKKVLKIAERATTKRKNNEKFKAIRMSKKCRLIRIQARPRTCVA